MSYSKELIWSHCNKPYFWLYFEDMGEIQDALLEVTGARSVPRVFINGKFYGGGDETAAGCASGDFAQKVASK